jgi:DNA-binding CsgD family transcriptional regulator
MAHDGKDSVADFKSVLRLVAETAELWYDPNLQRRYTLECLCKHLKATAGALFVFGDCLVGGETACSSVQNVGLNEVQEHRIREYLKNGKPADPALPKLMDLIAQVVVQRRRDLVADAKWYDSEYYKVFRQSVELDDTLYGKISVPGKMICIAIMRPIGQSGFEERERHMMDLALSQMAWPFQPEDAPTDPRLSALQPRLRKVMQHLLQGDSEKQVAAKLGLSKHTVHEYVKMLYQQLGVNSRGELLSQWVGRV